jgi:tetratricopeptide (TPR) repeat protein
MSFGAQFAYDFFVSRRGTAADMATEVATVLEREGYRVKVQDYDFAQGQDFVGDIHDALVSSRHLFVVHTADYDQNYWTRKEFTNFLASIPESRDTRRICMLRCDESRPRGILANVAYGDLVGVTDTEQRRQIILAAADGAPLRVRREPPIFGGGMPKKNANFTGRTSVLAEIENLVRNELSSPALVVVAICGLAGTGKTSIARACVELLAPEYVGVWWIKGQTRQDIAGGLAALGVRMESKWDHEADIEKVARATLARIERLERPLLIVFDNVDDASGIDDFLPTRGAHVLVTSRRSDWHGRAHEVAIDVMGEEEAVALLQMRGGRKDQAGARRLAQVLGFLPLALDHAGAYVRLAMSSFDAYAKNVDKLLARAPKDAPYPASVAATFALAIDNAIAECDTADTVLGQLAFVAPDRIPLELLSAIPEDTRDQAIMALTALSLVRADPPDEETPGMALHRLVQAAARLRLATQGKAAAALDQAIRAMVEAFPNDAYEDPSTWPRCELFLPHALAIRGHAAALGSSTPALPKLFDRVGEFLRHRAMLPLSEQLFRDAVALGETCHGAGSLEVARFKNNLANVLNAVGRRAEAEPLLRESLAVQEARLGRDDPGSARTLTSLAWVLDETGRHGESEQLLREAIASGERALGRAHPEVAVRINNLAISLQRQGRLDEAEDLMREAVEAGEQSFGRDHPVVATRLNNLASLLNRRGRCAEAEQLFREAIESATGSLGRKHPDVAVLVANLANVLRDQGRYEEAEPMYREAMETYELNHGARHPMTARIQRNSAVLQLATGRAEDALRNVERALAVHEEILGRTHPWTADSASTYAQSLERVGRSEDAEGIRSAYALPTHAGPTAAS